MHTINHTRDQAEFLKKEQLSLQIHNNINS
jgi:hypothetical protein